jgi:hypothetical protein
MKIKLSILLILFGITPVSGQFSYGIRAGANLNHISVKQMPSGTTDSGESSPGYQVSFYGQFQIRKKCGLAPEVQLAQRGAPHHTSFILTCL